MGGNLVWPKVSEVAEYRKKVRQTMLDVIENTPLELPVTQENKWVLHCLFFCFFYYNTYKTTYILTYTY